MKKLLIAIVILISAGLLPSCTQQVNNNVSVALEYNTSSFKKDLSTAD